MVNACVCLPCTACCIKWRAKSFQSSAILCKLRCLCTYGTRDLGYVNSVFRVGQSWTAHTDCSGVKSLHCRCIQPDIADAERPMMAVSPMKWHMARILSLWSFILSVIDQSIAVSAVGVHCPLTALVHCLLWLYHIFVLLFSSRTCCYQVGLTASSANGYFYNWKWIFK